jgi:CRISPR-associated protein Csd1
MILQALNDLFDRLEDDGRYDLPKPGFSVQKITFCIVLHPDGRLHDIEDIRVVEDRGTSLKAVPRQLLVPGSAKPSGTGISPCTLWDNAEYLLGYKKDNPKPNRSAECQANSAAHHVEIGQASGDPGVIAVGRFLSTWTAADATSWQDTLDNVAVTGFGVFRLVGQTSFVHDGLVFTAWWREREGISETPNLVAPCLVTGAELPIARLAEPAIKGVSGAAPSGAKLASFNQESFESYGKKQTYNAPVSTKATFRYCNALNALLRGGTGIRHRLDLAGTTVVFWTERETRTESIFAAFIDASSMPDVAASTGGDPVLHARIAVLYEALRKGGGVAAADLDDDPLTRFFVLGLAPNKSRLVVRFWHVSSVGVMLARLYEHFELLRIAPSRQRDPAFPPLWALLGQTTRDGKGISPLLPGAVMRAILEGTPYPMALYTAIIHRIRSDQTINYLRAAILKAVLVRNNSEKITMSLDVQSADRAYLLGRLFAALEKTQEDALPGINATIRDRYYAAASATPGIVFPRILRTYQHHLSKLEGGHRVTRDRLVQSIHSGLDAYPSHLTLAEQGRFAIGYYHQRQNFFTPRDSTVAAESQTAS